MPRFVQLPHRGLEAKPDNGDFIHWNTTDDHRRKFMQANGSWLDAETVKNGSIWLWGEWEPEFKVAHKFTVSGSGLPHYLWRPHWIPKPNYRGYGYQNTDPCVFGGFYYAICRQPDNEGLRELPKGSVIVFGSDLNHEWVVDTVFVVSKSHPYTLGNYQALLDKPELEVPEGYREVVLEPGCCRLQDKPLEYMLYIGATYENRKDFDGMFSFFPCQPQPRHLLSGFRRPAIKLPPKYFTPNLREAAKGAMEEDELEAGDVKALWLNVMNQVLDEKKNRGVRLGISADFPERLGRR